LLREGLTRPWLFGTALRLARSVSWLLPASLRAKVGTTHAAGTLPSRTHARKVLLLNNCVQPSMAPAIDAATARVLDAVGVQSLIAPGSGCCGAIRQHLDDPDGARDNFRRNIDAWWPFVESAQVEAILINASGCGAMVKEYGHLLRADPAYANRARRIVELTRDVAEFLPDAIAAAGISAPPRAQRISFHPPCTLQHGLKIRGKVEALLGTLGAVLVPVRDSHLCCGSAGTYSLLQTELSQDLRTRKLAALHEKSPQIILSANIGCIAHLQGGTATPVRHWIEWVDETLAVGCRK
jgi:glycolate oxidase iron-sulfur subunit